MIKNNHYIKKIFVVFYVLFCISLYSQNTRTKIYQTACVDLGKIISLIDEDEEFRKILDKYQTLQLSNAEEIRNTIEELENYLNENQDFPVKKKKTIINDIEFHKSSLKSIVGEDTIINQKDDNFLFVLYQVIKKIAEREGFSLVVEKKSAVLYYTDEVDITEKVIAEIKNQFIK